MVWRWRWLGLQIGCLCQRRCWLGSDCDEEIAATVAVTIEHDTTTSHRAHRAIRQTSVLYAVSLDAILVAIATVVPTGLIDADSDIAWLSGIEADRSALLIGFTANVRVPDSTTRDQPHGKAPAHAHSYHC